MFIPPLTMSIDLITLGYSRLRKNSEKQDSSQIRTSKSISVFIPSFNEGEKIKSTLDSILKQTYPPKDIYILDDLSIDSTEEICKELEKEYNNVHHIRKNSKLGKAGNINALVKENNDLGDYVLVVDGDVQLEKNCLEELAKSSDNVAVVTGFGYTKPPTAYIPKMLYEGESWINSIFSFRKKAQDIRKAVFVICGALSLYDKNILKQIPIPERTLTEDTDYTWILQEKGHRVKYNEKARAVGNNPNSLKGYWKRYQRWFSGTFQGLYIHGFKELKKSKPLLYSTILPGIIESIPYSLSISTLPATAILYPRLALGILTADFILSAPFLFMHQKGFWHAFNHLPDIYAYKYFGSLACMAAGIKTTYEKITGKKGRWKNSWENSSRVNLKAETLTKGYMKRKLEDFFCLEKEWTGLGETAWTKDNFMFQKPNKWELSSYTAINGKPIGYAIVSQPDKSKNEAYLHKIVVDSEYRGLGTGSLLLEKSIEQCKKADINKLIFKVRTDNESANRLYKKLGVNYIGKEVSPDNVERYLCELNINDYKPKS